jgi:medium-chain acyl-[acyl-carrier-protein] hydrolase
MSVSRLRSREPRALARARLFCFPYAGVGGSVYRLWPHGLPPALEVCTVLLPGREQRSREPAKTSIVELVDELVPALLPHLDLPFSIFGHSMGAVLASEVTRALAEAGHPLPQHLLVSGRRPPHLPGTESPMHGLPDPAFIAELNRRYRGIPAEILEQADLMALFLPVLRADLTALETHLPARRAPLSCPITVFGGIDDRLTPPEHLEAWRGETSGAFQVRMYAGEHFFLNSERSRLLADIAATLKPMLAEPSSLWSARA